MKHRTSVVLLATVVSAGAWAQEFTGSSTTLLQYSKQATPGFDTRTLAPGTEFLGLDATRLGSDALSLHLFGWGFKDFADASTPYGKSGGDLSYAYLDYRFSKANAELKAGRFSVNQGAGIEQVNGLSARTDLRGGFNLSAFAGTPVHYKAADTATPTAYTSTYQTDVIFGSRLGLRLGPVGEVGVSYVQEGSGKAASLQPPPPEDYTRQQVGTDLRIAPTAKLSLEGHTLWDVSSHYQTPGQPAISPSPVAEQDYTARYTFTPVIALTGNYTEHNLASYFAGTNLPTLFRTDLDDKHKAEGATLILGPAGATQVTVDYRHTTRSSYGATDRFGADVRWQTPEPKYQAGAGLHKVNAADLLIPGGTTPAFFGMSRTEARAWVMYQAGRYSASLDGMLYKFSDGTNPNLNGKSTLSQLVGSVGIQPTPNLSVSGDLGYGMNALYQNETTVLLRTNYRFSVASKGGSK